MQPKVFTRKPDFRSQTDFGRPENKADTSIEELNCINDTSLNDIET